MQKLFIFFLAIILSHGTMVYAQDDGSNGSGGSPESGDLFIEITGSPFDGSALLSFGTFRARYMVSDMIVPRIGLYMSLNNSQSTPDQVSDLSEYLVSPGLELHLNREGAFRSYVALDAQVGQRMVSASSSTGVNVDGSSQIPSGNNYSFSTGSRGYFHMGANLSAGADYHFSSRFYIGVEIGFQLYRRMYSEVKVDGDLYQDQTIGNHGSVNRTNAFRVGFLLF